MTTATNTAAPAAHGDESVGMSYLDRLPRRLVVIYLPLAVFVFVLLFPFYWMTVTALKPNVELTNFTDYSPFWPKNPTLRHIQYLLFETSYPGWLWNTMSGRARLDHPLARRVGVRGLRHRAASASRARAGWAGYLPRLPRPALNPLHSRSP